jgi:integrase
MARGAGGAAAGADSPVAISNADSHPVYRRCCAQNRLICTQPPVRPARPLAAHTRRSVSCGSGLGHLRDPSNTNADMRELFAFCGQPGLTSHIWGRAAATIMEPGGLSARAGADRPGHRQLGTTMNHYRGKGIRTTRAAQVAGSAAL